MTYMINQEPKLFSLIRFIDVLERSLCTLVSELLMYLDSPWNKGIQ